MGIDFFLYWFIVINITTWLTTLTYQFFKHKQSINNRVGALEFTVDDILKVIKLLKDK